MILIWQRNPLGFDRKVYLFEQLPVNVEEKIPSFETMLVEQQQQQKHIFQKLNC